MKKAPRSPIETRSLPLDADAEVEVDAEEGEGEGHILLDPPEGVAPSPPAVDADPLAAGEDGNSLGGRGGRGQGDVGRSLARVEADHRGVLQL